MRHVLFSALMLTGADIAAQISLEQVYPQAGYFHSGSSANGQLFLWEFEAAGMKYVKLDQVAKAISLFNLDHSPYHAFSFAQAPVANATPFVMYISQHLFDLDDAFEFLYFVYNPLVGNYLRIYKEDGSVLLSRDGCSVFVLSTIHQQQYPIYETPEGWKLILSCPDATAEVYSLPGGWSGTTGGMVADGAVRGAAPALLYPNPANGELRIETSTPSLTAIRVYDAAGRLVQEERVQQGAGLMVLATGALAKGSYTLLGHGPSGWHPLGQFIKE